MPHHWGFSLGGEMNEVDCMQMQEDAAYGRWLIETIALACGICPTGHDSKTLKRLIRTGLAEDCDTWISFDEDGILLSTMLKTDAHFRLDLTGLEPGEEDALCQQFWARLDELDTIMHGE
jgi:hypothetical protein